MSDYTPKPEYEHQLTVDTCILESETESDCDDGDGVPQVVPGVSDTESDDESL